ncbi:hypothetical protein HanRHA438_Chr09g0386161 [Helianthus annuus]|nr:hypothetical protein HanRHA438_Chr09g0386161 [Helianthus annuus]
MMERRWACRFRRIRFVTVRYYGPSSHINCSFQSTKTILGSSPPQLCLIFPNSNQIFRCNHGNDLL